MVSTTTSGHSHANWCRLLGNRRWRPPKSRARRVWHLVHRTAVFARIPPTAVRIHTGTGGNVVRCRSTARSRSIGSKARYSCHAAVIAAGERNRARPAARTAGGSGRDVCVRAPTVQMAGPNGAMQVAARRPSASAASSDHSGCGEALPQLGSSSTSARSEPGCRRPIASACSAATECATTTAPPCRSAAALSRSASSCRLGNPGRGVHPSRPGRSSRCTRCSADNAVRTGSQS